MAARCIHIWSIEVWADHKVGIFGWIKRLHWIKLQLDWRVWLAGRSHQFFVFSIVHSSKYLTCQRIWRFIGLFKCRNLELGILSFVLLDLIVYAELNAPLHCLWWALTILFYYASCLIWLGWLTKSWSLAINCFYFLCQLRIFWSFWRACLSSARTARSYWEWVSILGCIKRREPLV